MSSKEKNIVISTPLAIGAMLGLSALCFFSGYLYTKLKGTNTVNVPTQVVNQPAAGQQQAAAEPQQDLSKIPGISKDDYVRGNRNADVVLIEYSDYECPYCKKFHPTMQQVSKDYGDKIAWVYRHIPLGFHTKAQKSAEAVECAGDIGGNEAFWKMSDIIFDKMPAMELKDLPILAKQIGIDQKKFQSCLDSGKYKDKIAQQSSIANSAGIQGTPGTVIIGKNGKRDFIGGAYPIDQVKEKIDAILK
jgi:protein-disulfide isomerase